MPQEHNGTQRETATEAAPDKHETGALSRRPESLPMAHKPTKPATSPILLSLVMYSPPNSLNVKVPSAPPHHEVQIQSSEKMRSHSDASLVLDISHTAGKLSIVEN